MTLTQRLHHADWIRFGWEGKKATLAQQVTLSQWNFAFFSALERHFSALAVSNRLKTLAAQLLFRLIFFFAFLWLSLSLALWTGCLCLAEHELSNWTTKKMPLHGFININYIAGIYKRRAKKSLAIKMRFGCDRMIVHWLLLNTNYIRYVLWITWNVGKRPWKERVIRRNSHYQVGVLVRPNGSHFHSHSNWLKKSVGLDGCAVPRQCVHRKMCAAANNVTNYNVLSCCRSSGVPCFSHLLSMRCT